MLWAEILLEAFLRNLKPYINFVTLKTMLSSARERNEKSEEKLDNWFCAVQWSSFSHDITWERTHLKITKNFFEIRENSMRKYAHLKWIFDAIRWGISCCSCFHPDRMSFWSTTCTFELFETFCNFPFLQCFIWYQFSFESCRIFCIAGSWSRRTTREKL